MCFGRQCGHLQGDVIIQEQKGANVVSYVPVVPYQLKIITISVEII